MRKRSKLLVVIGIAIILCFSLVACGKNENTTSKEDVKTKEVATTEDNKGVKWPEGTFPDMLPNLPEGVKITQIAQDKTGLASTVKNISMDDCKDFAEKCKEKGFRKNIEFYEYEDTYGFEATDKKNYKLTIVYNVDEDTKNGQALIYVTKPEKETSKTK